MSEETWGKVTELDALLLGRKEFEKVWRALGMVAYARAAHHFVLQHDLPPLAESIIRNWSESHRAVSAFLASEKER